MERNEFRRWCEKAVSGIVYPPDRQKVFRELMEHMEDHYDALHEEGFASEIARQLTVEAMGDAYEIAPQLAQIHRPFWGRLLQATRVLLVLAAIVTLIPFYKYAYETDYYLPMWPEWELYSADAYGGDTGRTLLHLSKPNISQRSDGYTFTLTRAVQWYNEEYDNSCFFLHMKEFHPLPWAEHGAAGVWFWAEDSLGNVYECYYNHYPDEETPVMYTRGNETSPFSYTYQMWINDDIPEDAQWLDIRYTRDGRNLVFRIDLAGGDKA